MTQPEIRATKATPMTAQQQLAAAHAKLTADVASMAPAFEDLGRRLAALGRRPS